MAGVGVRLNKIYSKNSIIADLWGFGYSSMITIAPMVVVIAAVIIMQLLVGYASYGYAARELYSCTVLYIFIFALLTASPFNAVLSRYLSDVIYEERYDHIMPCYYIGLFLNVLLSAPLGAVFCVHEYYVGKVDALYVFAGFFGYILLMFVFYTMLYLSICKEYGRISLFFVCGMTLSVLMAVILARLFKVDVAFAMLVSLDLGFLLTGSLEFAQVKSYFRENSGEYRNVLAYFKKYWQLVFTNFLYTLGLYIHNFVFWSTDMHMIVRKSFVSMQTYDMATCLAMFTNISATVIFISRVEMHFHERYRMYSEAVIGGRGIDIEKNKKRMFEQLTDELMNLVRIQFIVSVVIFLFCTIFLPRLGFGGMVMKIYPCLAAGYFVLFLMYAEIIFLYYYNDLNGSLFTSLIFVCVTFVFALWGTTLPPVWYGIGPMAGSIAAFIYAYFRLRYIERELDYHIFCNGKLMEKGEGSRPSNKVFERNAG